MSTVLDHHHHRAGPMPVAPTGVLQRTTERRRGHSASPHPVVDLMTAAGEGELPDPAPLAANLALCVVEVLAGARDLDQLGRWVNDSVFVHLLRRSTIAAQTRRISGVSVQRPRVWVGEPIIARPSTGVVEAVVMVHQPDRSRAVAIRLDAVGVRWRASALSVL